MTSYKIATLITVVVMLSFHPQPTEAGFIGGCWATWSRCTRWSSWATGWLWKTCNDRCKELGYRSGRCVLRPSDCPLANKAYRCECS
uniref:Mytimacin-6 n=1 Tax=Mytilus galloprovincialis TaxID=29158 RepID=X2D385_MYTGA|nr:Mytimacin-6 [Mytilus galloprovincialis]